MSFSSFIGNEAAKSQIESFISKDKIPHAIILEGARGLGKRTLAKLISKACVCEKTWEKPCGKCIHCKKVDREVHPDVIYPEKSGALHTYNIETIREMREDAYIIANEAQNKVYVLTEVDNMGIPAQNALLKILEEPPANVIFILTCISSMNLLQTIRSRMQIISLVPVHFEEAKLYIRKKYKELPDAKIDEAVKISYGNIGLAIEMLTSEGLKETIRIANDIASVIVSPRPFELLKATSGLISDRKKFKEVLNFIIIFLREALILSYTGKSNGCSYNVINELANNLSGKKIIDIIEEINKTVIYIDQNVNLTLLSSNLCINLQSIVF